VSRDVHVDGDGRRYLQTVSVGPHVLRADEPNEVGGADGGPNPYELLLAALGTCTSITVQMYADRKGWPLQAVHVLLSFARVHGEDCATCDTEGRIVDQIGLELTLVGDLTADQRARLMEIANRCPAHRTLSAPVRIVARPAESSLPGRGS
jgi:putative redox protein